jgi:hypothetical protein
LIVAIPFFATAKEQVGSSTAISNLLKDFDFTIYSDIMKHYGKALEPFIGQLKWFGIFFLLFSTFLSGGILNVFLKNEGKFTAERFFTGGGIYFWRFFRLTLYIIIIHIILIFIIYFPLYKILDGLMETTQNEASIFYGVLIGVIIHILFFFLVTTIMDYAKIMIVKEERRKVFKTVWHSIKFVFKNFFRTYFLYLLLVIVPIALIIIYWFLDGAIGMVSGFTIFIMFLIQQIYIWLRVWIKIWTLGSEVRLFEKFGEVKGEG